MPSRLPLVAPVMLAAACSPAEAPPPRVVQPPPPATASAPPIESAGITVGIKQGMNEKVAPGDDFFAYANGGWLASTEISKDRASAGVWDTLTELTNERAAKLIKEVGESTDASGDAKKIADTYATFMDEAAIETKGLAPLEPALKEIGMRSSRAPASTSRRRSSRGRRSTSPASPRS